MCDSGAVPRAATLLSRIGRFLTATPMTSSYVVVFTVTTVLQRAMPAAWVDRVILYSSANLVQLTHRPVRVLLASAAWIADRGTGYLFYLGMFLLVVAAAERRLGSRRLLAIAVTTHVTASLIMMLIEAAAIRIGLAPASLASTSDVGVSYIMIGGCAAAVVTLSGRRRIGAATVLAAGVALPVVVSGSLWDIGHLVALGCAAATTAAVLWNVDRHRLGSPTGTWPNYIPRTAAALGLGQRGDGRLVIIVCCGQSK